MSKVTINESLRNTYHHDRAFSRKQLVELGRTPKEINIYTDYRHRKWLQHKQRAHRTIQRLLGKKVFIVKAYLEHLDTMCVYIFGDDYKTICEHEHDNPITALQRCLHNIHTKEKRLVVENANVRKRKLDETENLFKKMKVSDQ